MLIYMWASTTKPGYSRKKMELVIPLDKVNVSLSFSEKIECLPQPYIQSYAYLNFGYNQSSLNVNMEKKSFKV